MLDACDDATVTFLAALPFRQVVDIISQNQERMMRCDDIVEALGANPLTVQVFNSSGTVAYLHHRG